MARPDQETLPLPAWLALGAGAGPTAAADGPGARAPRRRLPQAAPTRKEAHPHTRAAARGAGTPPLPPSSRRSDVPSRPCGRPAKVTGAAGATHPVQVETLGAARGLLGAGAQAHDCGPAPAPVSRYRDAKPAGRTRATSAH